MSLQNGSDELLSQLLTQDHRVLLDHIGRTILGIVHNTRVPNLVIELVRGDFNLRGRVIQDHIHDVLDTLLRQILGEDMEGQTGSVAEVLRGEDRYRGQQRRRQVDALLALLL